MDGLGGVGGGAFTGGQSANVEALRKQREKCAQELSKLAQSGSDDEATQKRIAALTAQIARIDAQIAEASKAGNQRTTPDPSEKKQAPAKDRVTITEESKQAYESASESGTVQKPVLTEDDNKKAREDAEKKEEEEKERRKSSDMAVSL